MVFDIQLKLQQRTRRFSVRAADAGWEIRDEENGQIVKQARCVDWHRVEMACVAFRRQADLLCQDGWLISSTVS